MANLRPISLGSLVARMFRELDAEGSIYDLPLRRFFLGGPDHDFSVTFQGQRASTPLGPAAGPHTQMAQNIVLSWLGGSRILELKTVQVNDELIIPRPCIDMQTVGYNVEWSQELKLEQSLEEYVKGAMLVKMLEASGKLPLAPGSTDTIFDMSVGYDLVGIRGDAVRSFIDGMRNAGPMIDRLRREIPAAYGDLADLPFETDISRTLTLSTFHGCPPREIEDIISFLLQEMGLHCIVKLNPMLLGPATVRHLLHDELGFTDIRVPDSAFERDTNWEQAVEFVGRLGDLAAGLGLGFGVKFTNTLIVENHRDFFPAAVKEMYLSGQPLHVLAMHLVQRFRETFGDRFPISFSAGIDRKNFPDAVSLGLAPITVCTDLLKTGGYARQHTYLDELHRRMDAVGTTNIRDFIIRSHSGEIHIPTLVADVRYQKDGMGRSPRKIGSDLELFDCVTCDKCIPVCPNGANFALPLTPAEIPIRKLRRRGGGWIEQIEGSLELAEKHQIANFADFCNDCGNCDVFCPEDGGPYVVKPRFFGSLHAFMDDGDLDGFCVLSHGESLIMHGRFSGREFLLDRSTTGLTYHGDDFELQRMEDGNHDVAPKTTCDEIDLTLLDIMLVLLEAVLSEEKVNYVNVGILMGE